MDPFVATMTHRGVRDRRYDEAQSLLANQPLNCIHLRLFNRTGVAGVLFLLVANVLLAATVSASSSGAALSPGLDDAYSAVTALDRYGNSVQLQHAREAGLKHGALILAGKANDHSTVVVSVQSEKPGLKRTSEGHSTVLTYPLSVWDPSIALVCSGVKADADWLLRTMRDYFKRRWGRYNKDDIGLAEVGAVLRTILLSFMGYSQKAEFWDGSGTILSKDDALSRPLGVTSMIVSARTPIVLVGPSGVPQSGLRACAIGRDSDTVTKSLEEHILPGQTVEEVKDGLLRVLKKHLSAKHSNRHRNDKLLVCVEVVSHNGVVRTVEPIESVS